MNLNSSRRHADVNTKSAIDAHTWCWLANVIGVEEKTRSDQRGEEYWSLYAPA